MYNCSDIIRSRLLPGFARHPLGGLVCAKLDACSAKVRRVSTKLTAFDLVLRVFDQMCGWIVPEQTDTALNQVWRVLDQTCAIVDQVWKAINQIGGELDTIWSATSPK